MNAALNYQIPKTPAPHFRVTEIIIPQAQQTTDIVFPLVAAFSQQVDSRWVTWLCTQKPSRSQLIQLGVNIEKLRVVHLNPQKDNRWLIWEAMNTGNSHTVICDQQGLDKSDLEELEKAAAKGNCTGVMIRSYE